MNFVFTLKRKPIKIRQLQPAKSGRRRSAAAGRSGAVDQQPVTDDVNQIGDGIDDHRGFIITSAPQSGS